MIRLAVAAAFSLGLLPLAPALASDGCKLPASKSFVSYSVGSPGSRTSGSGNITARERAAAGFTMIRVYGPLAVEARAAERENVTVRIDENLQSMVEVEVGADGTLHVRPKRDAGFTTRTLPVVTVDYVKLTAVAVEGSGDVIANNLRPVAGFRAAVAGNGDICLSGVRTAKLELAVAGSGDVRAIGASDELTVRISGSGDVAAQSLLGRNVKVSIAGSGDAQVNALETLEVSVAGSGDVRYAGTPKLKQRVSGSGTVKPL